MRKIMFRGKDVMSGDWVYGSYVKTGMGLNYILPQNLISNAIPQWQVDKETVGQYTGFEDKTEKQVFEGDIIKIKSDFPDEYHEVKFACGGFMAGELFLDDYWNPSHGYLFEVVGNKIDNPELLEDEE